MVLERSKTKVPVTATRVKSDTTNKRSTPHQYYSSSDDDATAKKASTTKKRSRIDSDQANPSRCISSFDQFDSIKAATGFHKPDLMLRDSSPSIFSTSHRATSPSLLATNKHTSFSTTSSSSKALKKFRYRPPPEPMITTRAVDPAASRPPTKSASPLEHVHPPSHDQPKCSPPLTIQVEAKQEETLLVLPEYDEFGEVILSQDDEEQPNPPTPPRSSLSRPSVAKRATEQSAAVVHQPPSSIGLPTQIIRRFARDRSSSPCYRPLQISPRREREQPSNSSTSERTVREPTVPAQEKNEINLMLEDIEASGMMEEELQLSSEIEEERGHVEPDEPNSALLSTDRVSASPPLIGSRAGIFTTSTGSSSRTASSHPGTSTTVSRGVSERAFNQSSKEAPPIVETGLLHAQPSPRTSKAHAAPPRLMPALPDPIRSRQLLLAQHTPVPSRPTHRLVPLTPEGFTFHLSSMIDAYRLETAEHKAYSVALKSLIDEQADEIVQLRAEVSVLKERMRDGEKLVMIVDVLKEVRRGLLRQLKEKDEECSRLREMRGDFGNEEIRNEEPVNDRVDGIEGKKSVSSQYEADSRQLHKRLGETMDNDDSRENSSPSEISRHNRIMEDVKEDEEDQLASDSKA